MQEEGDGFFQPYLKRRKALRLEREKMYIKKKIQKAVLAGRTFFFLSVYNTLSFEMWVYLQSHYDVEEVDDGWNIFF